MQRSDGLLTTSTGLLPVARLAWKRQLGSCGPMAECLGDQQAAGGRPVQQAKAGARPVWARAAGASGLYLSAQAAGPCALWTHISHSVPIGSRTATAPQHTRAHPHPHAPQ